MCRRKCVYRGLNLFTCTVLYFDFIVVPTMEFAYIEMVVKESEKMVHIPIRRLGDSSEISSVICYTRQNTAVVMMDYDERPLSEVSRVVFLPGEKVNIHCIPL